MMEWAIALTFLFFWGMWKSYCFLIEYHARFDCNNSQTNGNIPISNDDNEIESELFFANEDSTFKDLL